MAQGQNEPSDRQLVSVHSAREGLELGRLEQKERAEETARDSMEWYSCHVLLETQMCR